MEEPQKKPKSPWFYVLLGCLGLGGVLVIFCLASGAYVVKKGSDTVKGITDPQTRQENAVRMLGTMPEGYFPRATLSMFGMLDMADLIDAPPLADGGFAQHTRQFVYVRVMSNENNKRTRAFFTSQEATDDAALRQSGLNLEVKDVIKKGNLVVDGRKIYYVASRGTLNTGSGPNASTSEGLQTSLLFDCPNGGDELRMGVWMMMDPSPQTPAAELDLTGTVADEAKLAAFLKPVDPCGK